MRLHKRIGIIGCGNMGGAILAGLIQKKIVSPSRIMVYDKMTAKGKETARQKKVRLGRSNREVVDHSDIILLAVKPQDLFDAASEFREAFSRRHLLITILAGTPIAKVRRAIGPKPKIVRAMPNLGAQVGEAITAITVVGAKHASPLQMAEIIFSGCGQTVRLSEKYLDLVTAISGSGPAYFFLLMELLAKEGKSRGLNETVARQLAVQTAVGAGVLARNSKSAPDELRKKVTSKGGTTEAALRVFEKEGLPSMVSKAIGAAFKRGRELSRQ